MNIILFGFKCSGKTHFGKMLAQELNRPFIDTDERIIEGFSHSLPISQIYRILGEKEFRNQENVVIQSLAQNTRSVIALGGGTILNPENVKKLQKTGCLIYLAASFKTVQQRIFKKDTPAFIDANDPINSLRTIYDERTKIYESIRAPKIDTDNLDDARIIAGLISISLGDTE